MKWNIVADSSIELFEMESNYDNISFSTVPFAINVGEEEYIDDESMDVSKLVNAMSECKSASSTACPAPGAWFDKFSEEGNVIAITITSGLSGSYNSACAAKTMVLENEPDKKIAIIDSLSVGPAMVLILRKLCELISNDIDFEDVIDKTHQYMKHIYTSFALSSFDNLVKNGRMNKITGFIANRLGIIGIGIASEKGTIDMKGVARGKNKALGIIIDDMKQRGRHLENVVISHCHNPEFAEKIKEEVLSLWSFAQVTIIPSRGLCSYYAEENGLIIGFQEKY